MGPRGTFVTFSHHGIYYRKRIVESQFAPNQHPIRIDQLTDDAEHIISSADINQLTDTDSKEFINELTAKSKKISFLRWFGFLPAILYIIGYISHYSQITKTDITTHYDVEVNSTNPVNIRTKPDKTGAIFGKVKKGDKFWLLDSTIAGWNKIRYADSDVYIAKSFSNIDSTITPGLTHNRFEMQQMDAISTIIGGALLFGLLFLFLHRKDRSRLLIEIQYDMDEHISPLYNQFISNFSAVLQSKRVWQYLNAKNSADYKHNAGAGTIINRIPIPGISADKKPARFFITNIKVPNLKLRNTDLYFFPERLIVKRGNQFAAVFYKHLAIESVLSRFIESEFVPSDSQVVDYTWLFLNKNGSPDKRFNNNKKLPICLYSNYTISSNTGVYEIVSTSKTGAFDNFAEMIKVIGEFQVKAEATSR